MRATAHFLEHGYQEGRDPAVGPLPDGLPALAALPFENRVYASTLFRSVFLSQVRHPDTVGRLWAGADRAAIEAIRSMGGRPYFIFGDSHANHYARDTRLGAEWLAGMPIVCLGASAAGLTGIYPPSRFGSAILRWAAASAPLDVPIFLKFGGIDAEFRWIAHRLRNRIAAFSERQFDDYAKEAVAQYGHFLERLADRLSPAYLRVCAAFPTCLTDRDWIDGYIGANGGSAKDQQTIRTALRDMEIPDFATRTRLRGLYNAHLRALCDATGQIFVDDFTPFLDRTGGTDRQYMPPLGANDFHIDHAAIGPRLEPIIDTATKATHR